MYANPSMWSNTHTPAFSATPASFSSSQTPMVPFSFELNPNVLNCTIMGSRNKVFYRIATDSPKLGVTYIYDAHGSPIVIIEWHKHPILEIRGVIPKQHISHWLALAPGKAARTMTIAGKQYIWAPGDNELCLFDASVGSLQLLAKATTHHKRITLEVSPHAIQGGLSEAIVAATILLLSGRSFDH
ncbi:hypothetical protein ONZ45_g5097 [Pleurotus djamor]|nr:hypothetical protein ONZ45_g5097 [Pleurotus djamor]